MRLFLFAHLPLQVDTLRHVINQTGGYSDGLGGNSLYSPHNLNVSTIGNCCLESSMHGVGQMESLIHVLLQHLLMLFSYAVDLSFIVWGTQGLSGRGSSLS